jgi:hypothetical protein
MNWFVKRAKTVALAGGLALLLGGVWVGSSLPAAPLHSAVPVALADDCDGGLPPPGPDCPPTPTPTPTPVGCVTGC